MNCINGLFITTLGLSIAAFSGCKSGAKYIETGGTQSVVSVGQVDIQDIQMASSELLQSMIATGVLKRSPTQPARLLINPIVNDTSSQFDVGELTYRMREQLVNSGQAQVITAYGKYTEDPAALEELKRRSFESGTQPDVEPDYTLSGKITQLMRNSGSTRQSTFTFRLTLTDPNTGLEVWTKLADVTKQGQKDSIGF
ncbi:MAG: hypothetical protein CBC35_08745 [Planctomycetes bacterium TMED75]|nr:hypothetical protein [Planctomycetaceae bacterium]OUU91764.1 MAG: hypothetical protein CBC35_08745 [Planctomycetes bacterium TMED75]